MDRSALDAAPIPTVVLRDTRVAYANDALLSLLKTTREAFLGRPYTDFVAPDELERVADRQARRLRGEHSPSVYVTTLLWGTERRSVRVHAAASGGDIVVQFIDVTGEAVRSTRLSAMAQLGALVQRELREDDVRRTVLEALPGLELEGIVFRPDGDELRVEDARLEPGRAARFELAFGKSMVGSRQPWIPALRQAWRDGAVFMDEWLAEARRLAPGELPAEEAADAARRSAAAVRVDVGGRPDALLVAVGPWLRAEDLPAFWLFGSQVSAALDAARSIQVLSRRNAELAALNRVAEAAGSAPDVQSFLARASQEVASVLHCTTVGFSLLDREQREWKLLHLHGGGEEDRQRLARAPLEGELFGRPELDGLVQVRHASESPEPLRALLHGLALATVASVPVRFRSTVIGVMTVGFRETREPAECRTELLQAMGAHFAGAVETHRLLGDLRGRVAELTLLNDIAVATATLDPVLLLENALRRISTTFRADAAAAFVLEGDELVQTASLGTRPGTQPGKTRFPLGFGPAGLAVAQRKTIHLPDLAARGEPTGMLECDGISTAVGVPLLVKDRALGAFLLGRRPRHPFSDAELALLSAIGVQLGVAVENARLFASEAAMGLENAELYAEEKRRVEELSLLNEVGRSVAGSLDLDRILGEGARAVRQLLSTTHCHVLLVDAVHRELRFGASTAEEVPGLLDGTASLDAPLLAAAAVRERRPFAVHELAGSAFRDVAEEAAHGAWAVLAAPVLFRDQPMGVLVVCEHGGPRRFTAAEIERAMAVANQLAVAIDNARLFDETRRRAEELELLQDQLVHQERLAALGELAAVVAHEVRNPLGAIFNSLGTLRRMVRPRGDAKMLFDIVGEEADHLNRIVGQLLDFARPAPATMRAEPLDRVLDEAVAAALAEAHGRIALVRDVPDGLPLIPMDAGLIRQALLNVALNAVQAMPKGGTLSVHARLSGEAAVVELADTGPGIPEEVRHRIFEPFFTTKATGTGLGLAVVKRILEDHRGRVEVRGRDSGGTVFALHLPLTTPEGRQRRAIPSADG